MSTDPRRAAALNQALRIINQEVGEVRDTVTQTPEQRHQEIVNSLAVLSDGMIKLYERQDALTKGINDLTITIADVMALIEEHTE